MVYVSFDEWHAPGGKDLPYRGSPFPRPFLSVLSFAKVQNGLKKQGLSIWSLKTSAKNRCSKCGVSLFWVRRASLDRGLPLQ